MIESITEINFPSYATLASATVNFADMGERTIEADIRIDGDICPDFSKPWEIEYRGERYVMPLRKPQGSKGSESVQAVYSLVFQHKGIQLLKQHYFVTVQSISAGVAIADKRVADVSLNLGDFCKLLGRVSRLYYGAEVYVDLNPRWQYAEEPKTISISYSTIWDVLLKLYEVYGVRWTVTTIHTDDGEFTAIHIGYDPEDIGHVFSYGFEGGLLKVERQVQSADIRNIIYGRGGDRNLPLRYHKGVDANNSAWAADPDAAPELASIHFDRLRGATFRSYMQGWNAQHYEQRVAKEDSYAPWAWERGFTDEKFDPVEYVKDDESIAEYGEWEGGADNQDDIYPTIQGVVLDGIGRADQIVDIEQVTTEPGESQTAGSETETSTLEKLSVTVANIPKSGYAKATKRQSKSFTVHAGKKGDVTVSHDVRAVVGNSSQLATTSVQVDADSIQLRVVNVETGEERSAVGIPAGEWRIEVTFKVHNLRTDYAVTAVVDITPTLVESALNNTSHGTFDIWVKDIWQTSIRRGESPEAYAKRVWEPILGDRTGKEAKVLFTSGNLALSTDYEFLITKMPVFDTSRSFTLKDKDGNTVFENGEAVIYDSEWRITLELSDADYESLGHYVPYKLQNGTPGDYFCFIGIDMPFLYVDAAERRLDDYKKELLEKSKDIMPTWAVTTDRVRMSGYGAADALIHSLDAGKAFRLEDKRFLGDAQQTLYIQNMSIKYREPSDKDPALNPDVELTLGNSYSVHGSSMTQIQGDISEIQKSLGAVSNIRQVVRSLCDSTYLNKTRADKAQKLITFADGAHFGDFVKGLQGGMGGAVDDKGNAEFETLRVRSGIEALEYTVNRLEYTEGDKVFAEGDRIDKVVEIEYGVRYGLYLHPQWEGYVTAQVKDNILKGVINTMGSASASYRTSWMFVTYVDTTLNYIEVQLYDDSEIPGSENYIPVEDMRVVRWGNRTDKTRQSCFYVSSREGRMVKLTGVDSPILSIGNYGLIIGELHDVFAGKNLPINAGQDYAYLRGLIVQDIVRMDYKGNPVVNYVDRGEWVSTEMYYHNAVNEKTGIYETSEVWHNGIKWRCLSTGTKAEPTASASAWAKAGGSYVTRRWLESTTQMVRRSATGVAVPAAFSVKAYVQAGGAPREEDATAKVMYTVSTATAAGEEAPYTSGTSISVNANATLYTFRLYTGTTVVDTLTVPVLSDGKPGADGSRGPSLRGPQMWNDVNVGYTFYAGADNEQFVDVVIYDGQYYICKKTHVKTDTNYPNSATTTGDGKLWQLGDKMDLVATRVLLANNANIANFLFNNERLESQTTAEDGTPNIFLDGRTGEASFAGGAVVFNQLMARLGWLNIINNDLVGYDSDGVERLRITANDLPSVTGTEAQLRIVAYGAGENCDPLPTITSDGMSMSGSVPFVNFETDGSTTLHCWLEFTVPDDNLDVTIKGLKLWSNTEEGNASGLEWRLNSGGWSYLGDTDPTFRVNKGKSRLELLGSGYFTPKEGEGIHVSKRLCMSFEALSYTRTQTETVIGRNGLMSIFNGNYLRFSASNGFEVRMGANTFRVSTDGIYANSTKLA